MTLKDTNWFRRFDDFERKVLIVAQAFGAEQIEVDDITGIGRRQWRSIILIHGDRLEIVVDEDTVEIAARNGLTAVNAWLMMTDCTEYPGKTVVPGHQKPTVNRL